MAWIIWNANYVIADSSAFYVYLTSSPGVESTLLLNLEDSSYIQDISVINVRDSVTLFNSLYYFFFQKFVKADFTSRVI